ncbi:MAG: sigma-70 family RNA polymerase sigma factor [Tepidisphaeraceae bacterium]
MERLFDQYRPLVVSICRRYLRGQDDIDDAVQETFLKLLRHVDDVEPAALGGWLSRVAHAACVDLIRSAISERRRRTGRGQLMPIEAADMTTQSVHDAIRGKLIDAIGRIDATSREWIVARFYRKTELRILAARMNASVPTASRRVAEAVRQLAGTLRELGVSGADDLTLAEHFGDPTNIRLLGGAVSDDGLRFASDWRGLATTFGPTAETPSEVIRVGVHLSYFSTTRPGYRANIASVDAQLHSISYLPVNTQLIGVIEPDTDQHGTVERAPARLRPDRRADRGRR